MLVREGQMVEANQVVIRLDDAVTRANYESSRQRYLGLRATGRSTCGRAAGPSGDIVSPGPARSQRKSDPLIRQHIIAQNQLLQSRRASLAANLAAIDETIQGQQALIDRLSRRAGQPSQPGGPVRARGQGRPGPRGGGLCPVQQADGTRARHCRHLRVDGRPAGQPGARAKR